MEIKLPYMGNLRRPRKTNTKAISRIQDGDLLWDKRAVDRAATNKAQARLAAESHRTTGRLSTRHRILLMKHLGSRWSWKYLSTSILGGFITAPEQPTESDLEALIAGFDLPYVMRACVTVSGLSAEQLQYVVDQAPDTLRVWTRDQGELASRVRRSRPTSTPQMETP